MIKAEIITVGDEILIGQIVDTNSAWIGEKFSGIGVPVSAITSVGDDPGRIKDAVTTALSRSEVVVVTGGLGPTRDDITKRTFAEMFGVPMVRDEATYAHVERMLSARGVEFNALNRSQADIPQGAYILTNDNGTAPGMMFERGGKLLFSLPGVPFEMKALVGERVIPAIRNHFELRDVVHRTVVTFGMAESVLSETIAPWEDALPAHLKLAYLPNPRGIRLRLSAYDVDHADEVREMEEQFARLREIIRPYFLGYEPATVESSLAGMLREHGATVSLAESCTGGEISARITALAGASEYYKGGITSYDNSVKSGVLGIDPADLENYGAVSRQVVEQMARGARRLMDTDFAIATSGIAGPDGGTPAKPVGTVWMAIAWDGGALSRCMLFGKLREENIARASSHALNMLRLHLMEYSESMQNTGML